MNDSAPCARVFTVNGTRIACEVVGRGPALLLIHGLGSSGADWAPQIAEFTRDHTVIAPDLRGHGRSDKPPGPYSMRQFADDLAALLGQLGVRRAHVVGLSLGGGIAFQLAVQNPELVRSLVVVNSGPELIARTFKERITIWQRFAIVRLFGLRRMAAILADRLFPDRPELRAPFVDAFGRNDPAAYLASLRAFVGWSVLDRLDTISSPTLVVAADHDYTPVSAKQSYVARIPGARLAVLPDARHALPVERPEAFNRCLAEFLACVP